MNEVQDLKDLVATIDKDANDFYVKGNKAAGTRLRKTAMQIRLKAQLIREDVSKQKKQ